MDAVSVSGENSDAEIMDPTKQDRRPVQESFPSEIPEVSLCPPDCQGDDTQTVLISSDEHQPDSLSVSKPLSSQRIYHQVSQTGSEVSLQLKRCHCCGRHQALISNACQDTHGMTAPTNQDCSSEPGAAKTIHSFSPTHKTSCHNTVQCHWLQGSCDKGSLTQVQHHVVTVRNDGFCRIPSSYTQVIVDYPVAVLLTFSVLLLSCSLAGLLMGSLPDFSDPLMGFEPRGTDIGIRLKAWTKLQQNTGPGKFLSSLPHPHQDTSSGRDNNKEDTIEFQEFSRQRLKRMLDQRSAHHKFFCEPPGGKYAKLVFRSGNSASLWSLKAIYSMCEMEQSWIRSQAHFQELCKSVKLDVDTPSSKGECCPSWSLGNYLVFLNNVSSCFSLTQQQVSETLSLLRHCAPYYHDGRLVPSCAERGQFGQCATVPTRCKHSGAIYQILNFLVDKDFLGPQTVEYQVPSLKYSLMFLPVERGASLMEIYLNHLEGHELTYKNTTITGMDLGIKQKLFKYYLARDSVYPVLAVVVLLSAMALYHRSFFLLTVSFLAVTCSLLTSYFFYRVAFQLKFFPFLNLTAVLVLFGSCANYTFTFFDSWAFHLSYSPPASVESRMSRVMQEIGCLILTSGLTSSATFFAGYVSSITAIRCFAVFMGTASLVNTVFAFVWLPCSLVLLERYIIADPTSASDHRWKPCCSKNIEGFWDTTSRKRCLFNIAQKIRGLKRGLSDTSNILFLKILPCGVVKFRYIWICWFAVFAAGGTYISCVGPGMKLPSSDSQDTQLFRSSHPFERYDSEYRHQFMFERKKRGEDKPYTITIVWGIIPTDSGDHFDPKSEGNLVLDPDFNMSSPDAQVWLRDLCAKIQNQSFYSQSSLTHEAKEDNACFVEQLVHWVSIRHCSENEDSFLFCCNNIPFPYPSEVFEHCIKMMTIEQHLGGILPNEGGLRFDSQGRISAFIVEFSSSHLYSFNFSQTTYFYNEIQAWFQKEMSGAPPGLHKGWFVSQLTLYDLQDCLSSETLEIAGFSIVLTFAMLLLTTWNIPLSIYGTAAVGGSVFVTVGLLVLLEWQLNGIEALLISAAAGLSVDFAANYCISYSLAPHTDRLGRVAHSLKRMGCPVATGAGAYFCVGVLMLPATALLFRKVGIFLLLVKCVACGFATFFFQSLCCFFGPQKNCGRIFLPCTTEKTAESVLSSCSAAEPGSSNPSANGAFGCSSRPGDQRNFNKEAGGGFLCPHQQHQRPRATGDGREPEQYELQPLACQLSDSFENSTCTSKLSNRPSVLSDDIQFYGHSPRTDYDLVSMEDDGEDTPSGQLRHCNPPPALQTSSPYKENALYSKMIPPDDLVKDKILCKKCRSQSGANKNCNPSISSTSTEDIAVGQITSAARGQRLLLMDEASRGTLEQHPHKRLLSCQSQSSLEGPEDSNETCLSDIESGSINPQTTGFDIDGDLQPGHLNGKRDTLRLSLRGNVYDTASLGGGRGRTSQSDLPVILPNSKPDLPDVWIKRGGNGS